MAPKLVIFDLDNTLIRTKPAAKEGYKQAIYYLARQSSQAHNQDKLYNHWKRIVSTLLGERKPHKRRFAYSLKALMAAHHLPETYYQQTLNLYEKVMLEHLEAQPGAKDLLSGLYKAGIKIAVTTGSEPAEAVKKLKAAELYPLIDVVITANDVGSMKPHPDFYLSALKQFKVKPESAVVIGDNQAEDINPALKLGLKAFRVTPQTHLASFRTDLLE